MEEGMWRTWESNFYTAIQGIGGLETTCGSLQALADRGPPPPVFMHSPESLPGHQAIFITC